MSESEDAAACPVCGGPMQAAATEGLCPKCVMAVMLDFDTRDDDLLADDEAPAEGLGTIGDYEILERIAAGAMGVVYRARQRQLDRLVALKLVAEGKLASTTDKERFLMEARAAGELDHPNIVPIYEVGEDDGQYFFSMRLVTGGSLADQFERDLLTDSSASRSGALRERQTAMVRFMIKVARAVHHAHTQGILHRDLKPANILIDQRGEPQISDFGLAKRVTEDTHLTASGQLLGSPAYMSPEQAEGMNHDLTPATDVYAIGVMLYQSFTGKLPFDGPSPMALLQETLTKEPVPPRKWQPRLDVDLETITLCCLEKAPGDRYASAEALAEDLERWLDGRPIVAKPSGPLRKVSKWVRRKPAIAGLIATTLIAVAVVAGLSWRHDQAASTRAREAYVEGIHRADQLLSGGRPEEARAVLIAQPEALREFAWHWLHHLSFPDYHSVNLGEGNAHALCQDPDGLGRLLIQQRNGQVKRWDLDSGQLAEGFAFAPPPATAFRGGNAFLLAGESDEDPRLILPTQPPRQGTLARALAAHADGFLASAPGERPTVFVTTSGRAGDPVLTWEAPWTAGRERFRLSDTLLDVAVSPRSQNATKYRIAFCYRATIEIWQWEGDVFFKKDVFSRAAPTSGARLCFSPNGRLLLLGDSTGKVIARNRSAPGAVVMERQHQGGIHAITSFLGHLSEHWVAAADGDGVVRAWEIRGESSSARYHPPFGLASDGRHFACLTTSQPSRFLFVSVEDMGGIALPEVPDGMALQAVAVLDSNACHIGAVGITQDELRIYLATRDAVTLQATHGNFPSLSQWQDSAVVGSHWHLLLKDGRQVVVDLRAPGSLQTSKAPWAGEKVRIFGHANAFCSMMEETTIHIAHAGGMDHYRFGEGSPVAQYVLSPDGRTMAAVHTEGELRLWHVPTGDVLLNLGNHLWEHLAFSANGATLLGYHSGNVEIWKTTPLSIP